MYLTKNWKKFKIESGRLAVKHRNRNKCQTLDIW